MLNARHVLLAATMAASAHFTVAVAQSPFRDREFTVDVIQNYEWRDLIDDSLRRNDPSPGSDVLEGVNGKLVWGAAAWSTCLLSMVYLPSGNNAGNIRCDPQRSGTESNWREGSATASFSSSTTIQGNVLILHGEMKGTHRFKMNHCGLRSESVSQFTVSQTLKMRIVGNSCQVLELENVEVQDEIGTLDGRPFHTLTRSSYAPTGACTMEVRSEQKSSGEELVDFDRACQ